MFECVVYSLFRFIRFESVVNFLFRPIYFLFVVLRSLLVKQVHISAAAQERGDSARLLVKACRLLLSFAWAGLPSPFPRPAKLEDY
jgi:hypothetical protein